MLSDREYVAHCQRRGRANPRQTDGNAQRPCPGQDQWVYEDPGCGYQARYKLWKSRGAEFITEPIAKYGEIRCYIRDSDGYIIEVGQSTDLTYG